MKLAEKYLLSLIKKEPVKVRQMISTMDTLDLKTKSQITALTYMYEKPEEHELRKAIPVHKLEEKI
ncbi:hypothetical protein [Metabacillus halosaccharovorans]|uniref:Uncharacterized protein n=1 Tax=Metabacillus halosaccharovorans TaxID=930124 RepID=A0ABT3DGT5_9BACI|nr:hypothetical protein [Metabacillus halosaccharovorans]MCV9886265.1 hypothetical protein [Metabacillus halosaccharovorans]